MGEQRTLTSVDLFAGCGGLTRGLEGAKFRCVAFNEVNVNAAASFQANFPDAIPFVGNIVDVLSNDIIKKELLPILGGTGKLDLLCGGPPCQEYSRSQVRRSQKVDTKDIPTSYLFQEMIRVIKILQPKVFLFENVEGLLTTKWEKKKGRKGEVFRRVWKDFESINGYKIQPTLIHAYNFGVPQNRPRVMIMGVRDDVYSKSEYEIVRFNPRQNKFLNGGKSTYSAELRNNAGLFPTGNGLIPPDIIDALDDLNFHGWVEGKPRHRKKPKTQYQKQMREMLGENWRKHVLTDHEFSNHRDLTIERFQHMIDNQCNMKECPERLRTNKNNQSFTPKRWKGKNPSITCQSIPDDYVHYSVPRTYSVREWARLQTLPDHHIFLGPRTTGGGRRAGNPTEGNFERECPKYTQIGNAVPPFMAKSIGERIISIIRPSRHDGRKV